MTNLYWIELLVGAVLCLDLIKRLRKDISEFSNLNK